MSASIPWNHEWGHSRRRGTAAQPPVAAQGLFEGCQSSVKRYLPRSACYQGLAHHTNNLHEENAAGAEPHSPCAAPQAGLQNLHPWVLSAEGQRHQIFPEILAAGQAGSTVQLVSMVHSIGCCQQRRGGTGGENRASTVRGQLIRKAARDVGLPDKVWDVPPALINANKAEGLRKTSWAPRWVYTQITG